MRSFLAGLFLVQFLFVTICHAESSITIDGSSTVFPLSEAVVDKFLRENGSRAKISVRVSGTTGGFKKFCVGEGDIQDASRPISKEEMDVCRAHGVNYIELPIAFDAIVIVTHKKNAWLNSVTISDLKKMWGPSAQGKITTWKAVNEHWPNLPLTLYGAGVDSGTFDYFTEAIVGKVRSSRKDFTGSEDDHVILQGVGSDTNSIGYIPLAYYEPYKDKLKLIAVQGGPAAPKNSPVLPTVESIKDGSYYPLSRPLFVYINSRQATRPEVKAFTEFYLKNAAELSRQTRYVPLPLDAYSKSLARFQKLQTGTAFGGIPQIGIHVNEMLTRTPAM